MSYVYSKNSVAYIYNPKNQSKEELINSFVVRIPTFKKLFKEIQESTMQHPEQHYLIEGKRGMGKTTLLLRLQYEIENDTDLNKWLIPVMFNEEEYSIRRLFKFWERVLEVLAHKDRIFSGFLSEIKSLSRIHKKDEDYEKALFGLLIQSLRKNDKKIVLFIDNFGDIFTKFNEKEAHRLRKILQIIPEIRIYAASSLVLESFYSYDHPFYEFFKVERLKGLNQKETQQLLLELGEHYKKEQVIRIVETQKGRIEAIRRITGGVIRTMVLLFEIFIDDENGNAFQDLESILDRVTPLYKHRMDDLSPPQQAIVEAIALAWDAVNVKEIREATRMESKVISSQLSQLVKNEVIRKIPTSTKNHLYMVDERFFNIWYLMRCGRHADQQRVMWLVKFLEDWCDQQLLDDRADQHIGYLKNGKYPAKFAYFMTEALAMTKLISDKKQDELISATRSYLEVHGEEYLEKLGESDKVLMEQIHEGLDNEKYELCLELADRLRRDKHFTKGTILFKKKEYQKAIILLQLALKNKNLECLSLLGDCYSSLEEYEEAESYYNEAIKNSIFNEKYKNTKDYYFEIGLNYLFVNHAKSVLYVDKFIQSPESLFANIQLMRYLISCSCYRENEFELSKKYAKSFINSHYLWYSENDIEIASSALFKKMISFLLTYNETKYLHKKFTSPTKHLDLKISHAPYWYALMYFMQDKYPDEYLRMGDELKQTVEEIIANVKKHQAFVTQKQAEQVAVLNEPKPTYKKES